MRVNNLTRTTIKLFKFDPQILKGLIDIFLKEGKVKQKNKNISPPSFSQSYPNPFPAQAPPSQAPHQTKTLLRIRESKKAKPQKRTLTKNGEPRHHHLRRLDPISLRRQSLIIAGKSNGSGILVLLHDLAVKSSHSIFFNSLQSRGFELDFKLADDPKISLQRYGQYLYDKLILFSPTAETPIINGEWLKRYIIYKIATELPQGPFCIVYMHSTVQKEYNSPGMTILRWIYEELPSDFKDRLQVVYFVHPGLRSRLVIATLGRFLLSGGIYWKIQYVSRLQYLWDVMKKGDIDIPEFVQEHDDVLEHRPLTDYGIEPDPLHLAGGYPSSTYPYGRYEDRWSSRELMS